MTNALIPVFAGNIAGAAVQLCDARTLHTFLQVKRDFTTWIKARIRKFGFVANEDYLLTKSGEQLPSGTKYVHDYRLTVGMAKELSMVENNEQGQAARRYFIACEKQVLAQLPTAPYAVQPPAASTLLALEQQAAGIVQANMTVAALFQVPLHLAQIESVKSARLKTGVDFAPLLLVSPAQDNIADADVMLEPRELAKHYKVPAHEMNLMLAKHGLQAGGPGNWHATDKGKAISSRHAWSCGTKSGYNLKWNVAAVRAVVK